MIGRNFICSIRMFCIIKKPYYTILTCIISVMAVYLTNEIFTRNANQILLYLEHGFTY